MKNIVASLAGTLALLLSLSFFIIDLGILKKHVDLPFILKINDLSYYIEPRHDVVRNYDSMAPSKSKKRPISRLISVGDVHGSYNELQKLLKKLKYDSKVDQIVFLGDFLSKGSQNFEVLNFAINENVQCVLGNHEISILKKYTRYYNRKAPNVCSSIKETECIDKEILDNNFKLKSRHDLELNIAKRLNQTHIDFLTNCPIILQLGPIGYGLNEFENSEINTEREDSQVILNEKKRNYNYSAPINGIAVHAGVQWDLSLSDQKVEVLTNIRALFKPDYIEPCFDRKSEIDDSKTKPWSKIWNDKQLEISNWDERRIVLYGHEASRGLVEREYSMGLDTGCVNGGKLTALVVSATTSKNYGIKYHHELVQVSC